MKIWFKMLCPHCKRFLKWQSKAEYEHYKLINDKQDGSNRTKI